jgi:hypothetical protein
MSETINDAKEPAWFGDLSQMSPWQQVSNRSILRIQQLSQDLLKDLEGMEFFKELGGVKEVLFAGIDHKKTTPESTWYNLRLCATFGLDPEGLAKDKNPLKILTEDHKPAVKALFECSHAWDEHTAVDHDKFIAALNDVRYENDQWKVRTPQEARKKRGESALDQLLIALAVVPYRGVLVSLLEEVVFKSALRRNDPPKESAVWFSPKGDKEGFFAFERFGEFSLDGYLEDSSAKPIGVAPFQIETASLENTALVESIPDVEKLYKDFLLDFTRGALLRSKKETDASGGKEFNRGDHDIHGFAIPAYDVWCPDEKQWRGGMTGWLVVFFKKSRDNIESRYSHSAKLSNKEFLEHAWLRFTDLVHLYVRRVREANMRDLLEDYADSRGGSMQPHEFFLNHLHQVIGYKSKRASGETDDKLEPAEKKLHVPGDDGRPDIEEDVLLLPTTCWKGCDILGEGTTYPPGTRRLCALFLDELELVRAKREEGRREGQQAGFFESAHDYSKDLNALDSQLAHFSNGLSTTREYFQQTRTESVVKLLTEIQDRLEALRVPEEWWLLRARFMMAHQRTETEGRLYEQPEWCLDLIKKGTRGDLYRLIKLLVWLPIKWDEHVERARVRNGQHNESAENESELSGDDLADWARLFSYDERGRHPGIDAILGQYMRYLFVGEKITKEAFAQRHLPPQLNREQKMSDPVLWCGLGESEPRRWKPVGTLCPLLVFSLRAAFQHAWLDQFLQAALHFKDGKSMDLFTPVTPSVTLDSIDDGTGFTIQFPNPNARINEKLLAAPLELPWGTWQRDISHYRNLCHPWHANLKSNPTQNLFTIHIASR